MATELAITRDRILEHAQSLPAAPQVLGGLCELLEDVNTDLGRIADEIRVDPALAARVLRLSNSVVFGGGLPVASIEEGVNRVGLQEIIRLVGVATVSGLIDRSLSVYDVDAARLREALLFHALAAEAVARQTTVEPRAAYAAGLLRGVGMMVLERCGRGRIRRPDSYDPARFPTYAEWERARFGVTSFEVAAEILGEWRFPAAVVAAMRNHVTLGPAAHDDVFAHVLHLGGAVLGRRALPGEQACWAATPERLGGARLEQAQFQAAAERAQRTFDAQRALL